jgi:glycosyltransferase involved in cell wall biosynthesis
MRTNAATPPLVSVVTPFHNTEAYLGECIESVLRQGYANFEYILVDNRSTDSSAAIARRYASADRRIRLIETMQLLPQVENYNFALRQISPDSAYVKVVEADNWIFPDCLTCMVELAEAHPRVAIVSSYSAHETRVVLQGLHISQSVVPGREVARIHLLGDAYWFGAPTTVLMRSGIVRSRDAFYSESARIAEDLMVCYDAFRKFDFGFVHQVLTFVRTENDSILFKRRGFPAMLLLDMLLLLKLYGAEFLSPSEYRSAYRTAKWHYYHDVALGALRGLSKDFWAFNRDVLQSIGARLEYGPLAWHVLRHLLVMLLNPGRSIRALGRWIRS